MGSNKEEWTGCQARSVATHVLSAIPTLMNLPRVKRTAGSTQRPASKMDSSNVNIRYRDGSISSVAVRDKQQVFHTRGRLMADGWLVMQNQTLLDAVVEQRQIEHNYAVKQFLRVDEGTYLPRRFRKREVGTRDSILGPSESIPGLQIIYVLHLGGQTDTAWIFEYPTPDEPSRKRVSLEGTDIIFVAGWMKDWRIPYIHEHATGPLAEIIYVLQPQFV